MPPMPNTAAASRKLAEAKRPDRVFSATPPIDVAMVEHFRKIGNALQFAIEGGVVPAELTPEALQTIKLACDSFVGWHRRVEGPSYISAKISEGCLRVIGHFGSDGKKQFELHGRRWRTVGGPFCSALEVSHAMGQPISYVNGLEDGLSAASEIVSDSRDRAEPRGKPEFVGARQAADAVGIPIDLFEQWIGAKMIPYLTLPGSDEPWFKITDVRRWVSEQAIKHGGLHAKPAVRVIACNESTPVPDWQSLPECLRLLDGVRDVPVFDSVSGVYFLTKGKEVVYVGQGEDVWTRIATHRREGEKDFDRAFFIPAIRDHLLSLERAMIDKLIPRYNNDGRTRSLRRSAASPPEQEVPLAA